VFQRDDKSEGAIRPRTRGNRARPHESTSKTNVHPRRRRRTTTSQRTQRALHSHKPLTITTTSEPYRPSLPTNHRNRAKSRRSSNHHAPSHTLRNKSPPRHRPPLPPPPRPLLPHRPPNLPLPASPRRPSPQRAQPDPIDRHVTQTGLSGRAATTGSSVCRRGIGFERSDWRPVRNDGPAG